MGRLILTLTVILSSYASVWAQQENEKSVSIFNREHSDKAWVVRYAKETGGGNKRGDLAVALRLKQEAELGFSATLLRYGGINVAPGKVAYKLQENGGKIDIRGRVTGKGTGNTARKPIRITGAGTYVAKDNSIHLVTLRGTYHPGVKVSNDLGDRRDDRLVVRILDKEVLPKGQNADAQPALGGGEQFVAFWVDPEPCEETPDTDIMTEETLPPEEEEELPLEPMPTFAVVESAGTTEVAMSTADTFDVALDVQPSADVTLTVTSSDTTQATVSPANLTFTPADWATPKVVTVTGVAPSPAATVEIKVKADSASEYVDQDHKETVEVTTAAAP